MPKKKDLARSMKINRKDVVAIIKMREACVEICATCGACKGARVEYVWCKGGARMVAKTEPIWGQGRGTTCRHKSRARVGAMVG